MSEESRAVKKTPFKRVPVILRSWDGPNSRIGLEVELSQMPWGPFDALGKRLEILLPLDQDTGEEDSGTESQVERALRHVEHAADRCGEFASLTTDNRESWRRSQETWEWIRKYLTSLWVSSDVDGVGDGGASVMDSGQRIAGPEEADLPALPGAASTLEVAAKALRGTPLSVWRETVGPADPEAPTREEAVQTLLGVARILAGNSDEKGTEQEEETPSGPTDGSGSGIGRDTAETTGGTDQGFPEDTDPDQVSFDFARGYDEGYQMGRKVGMALGTRKGEARK